MALGTPCITGLVPALAEVGGGAVAQVESLDDQSLGDAIVSLSRDRERREELRKLGLERARTFSWEHAARETVKVYRRAVEGRARSTSPVSTAYQSEAR